MIPEAIPLVAEPGGEDTAAGGTPGEGAQPAPPPPPVAHKTSGRKRRVREASGDTSEAGRPKRPKSAFLCFLSSYRDQWKHAHGDDYAPQRNICSAAGQAWRKLTPEQRAPFERLSEASKSTWAAFMQTQGGQRRSRSHRPAATGDMGAATTSPAAKRAPTSAGPSGQSAPSGRERQAPQQRVAAMPSLELSSPSPPPGRLGSPPASLQPPSSCGGSGPAPGGLSRQHSLQVGVALRVAAVSAAAGQDATVLVVLPPPGSASPAGPAGPGTPGASPFARQGHGHGPHHDPPVTLVVLPGGAATAQAGGGVSPALAALLQQLLGGGGGGGGGGALAGALAGPPVAAAAASHAPGSAAPTSLGPVGGYPDLRAPATPASGVAPSEVLYDDRGLSMCTLEPGSPAAAARGVGVAGAAAAGASPEEESSAQQSPAKLDGGDEASTAECPWPAAPARNAPAQQAERAVPAAQFAAPAGWPFGPGAHGGLMLSGAGVRGGPGMLVRPMTPEDFLADLPPLDDALVHRFWGALPGLR
eukprot:scaffold2.g7036.t1